MCKDDFRAYLCPIISPRRHSVADSEGSNRRCLIVEGTTRDMGVWERYRYMFPQKAQTLSNLGHCAGLGGGGGVWGGWGWGWGVSRSREFGISARPISVGRVTCEKIISYYQPTELIRQAARYQRGIICQLIKETRGSIRFLHPSFVRGILQQATIVPRLAEPFQLVIAHYSYVRSKEISQRERDLGDAPYRTRRQHSQHFTSPSSRAVGLP